MVKILELHSTCDANGWKLLSDGGECGCTKAMASLEVAENEVKVKEDTHAAWAVGRYTECQHDCTEACQLLLQ